MSLDDAIPERGDDDRPVEEDVHTTPPDELDPPLEADEADVLEQTLEVPPPDDDEP